MSALTAGLMLSSALDIAAVYPPASFRGGFRFWSHVVSQDMVFWSRLPDAIVPSTACDATGCHSGSTTTVAGVPTILYTGSQRPLAANATPNLSSQFSPQGAQVTSPLHFRCWLSYPHDCLKCGGAPRLTE